MSRKLVIAGSSEAAHLQARLHSSFFETVGLDWACELLSELSIEEVQKVIEKRDYSAIMLDDTYKELGVRCADVKAASAKLAFGAGLLVCKDEVLLAYELEGRSRVAQLIRNGFTFNGALVLVSGEGSSALADILAASLSGARKVVFISNNKQEAKRRLRDFVTEFGSLAYATIDLPPADEDQLSFREAYEHTSFSFGSYRTSTQIFKEADIVIDHRKQADPRVSVSYAVAIQETLGDIFQLDFTMISEDMLSIMSSAASRE